MRILTLNTHSLVEEDYEKKIELFSRGVRRMKPRVIALQEVNQSNGAPTVAQCGVRSVECGINNPSELCGYPLRADNHILRVRELLKKQGLNYNFVWRGMKEAYGMYEEGLGVLTRDEICDTHFVPLTPFRDDWKMRYALGVKVDDMWFYSVHTGRWDDSDEPFWGQIEKLREVVRGKSAIIMGDFNCPDKSDGYKILKATNWQDIWGTAPIRCGCATAKGDIDGWDRGEKLMRIDYIFSTFPVDVKEARVVFTKNDYGVVSDHYGLYGEFTIPV